MKQVYFRSITVCLLAILLNCSVALAQTLNVTGVVKDSKGEPLIGVSVKVKDKALGGTTNIDGQFSFKADKNDVLSVSYIGFETIEVSLAGAKMPLNIVLKESSKQLADVVVIGYGSVKKNDLTGSITTISDKNFQKGMISTPDQLISGKVAGVQITQNGGAPGAGSRIRIRGGASLNASNEPLIIIDGIPIDNNTVAGSPSVLSSINPADIQSMNVLKDASATAIYGSRASNGVILITTKSGRLGQKLNVNFSTQVTASTPTRYVDVLDGNGIRDIVNKRGDDTFKKMLGKANTNWQKEIYQTAVGTDNNLSISGSTSWLPYRVSLGYYRQDGILKTDNMQRVSGGVNLNPKFFNGDLSFNINVTGSQTKNRFADRGAIIAAISSDPTQSVKADGFEKFGGYYTWLTNGVPNQLAKYNPVAMLESTDDRSTVYSSIGSFKADYKLPFLKELKLTLNLGYDFASSNGTKFIPTWAPQSYLNQEAGKGGVDDHYKQTRLNTILEFYGDYNKYIEAIKSNINFMAGYSYQNWKTNVYNYPNKTAGGIEYNKPNFPFDYPQNTLVSFYGRLNYTLLDRYLLTATLRTDGSSRFAPKQRWGIFPSMALAWKIKQEAFLKDVDVVSDLKLRAGYGITGQQDGIANYSYMSVYYLSGAQSLYQLGDKFYHMYKPSAYDANIKWEQTATTNVGLDFGFLKNRISGSVDYYFKQTKDLLNEISIPAGANFSNRLLTNVGNIENQGLELSLNFIPIETKDWNWNVSANVTFNKTKITKLNQVEDPKFLGVPTGGIAGITSGYIQMHSVNYAPNTFFVHKQVYDKDGKPIEGLYQDLNNDGIINDNDKYYFNNPEPKVFAGLSTSLSYKNLTLSTSLRANFGNYVYDNISATLANYSGLMNPSGYIQNVTSNVYDTNFNTAQYYSDLYIKPASFLKMDNISLSYDFGRVWKDKLGISVVGTVQNVFTLSQYDGLDPEISSGIDYNFYPIPRMYSLKLNLTF